MVLGSLFGTRRARHGATAAVVVLATGGLFLLRAQAAPPPLEGPVAPDLMTPIVTVPPRPVTQAGPTAPLGPDTVSFSGPHVHGTLAVSGSRVASGGGQPFYADVTLNAEASPGEHAPLAMVVVLDTSGSMEGEKLREAKSAVKELVREMRDDDDVALVHYSDHAEVVEPLRRVGEVREALAARIDRLTAEGGTAIPLGLETGVRELEQGLARADRREQDRVRRVVLVSDGLDSSRRSSELLAQTTAAKGVTVSSMGIGLDFDESYMGAVARSGHGNFGFVNDGPTLTAFLKRELVETATTVAQGTVVHLHLADGLRFVMARGADAEIHGRDLDLRVGAVYADEAKRVLVEMTTDLPAGAAADLTGSVTWRGTGSSASGEGAAAEATIPQLKVAATDDASAVARGRNETVFARVASVEASERQLEAARAYANGDSARAQHIIQDNITALNSARRHAPAPIAAALGAQAGSYDDTMKEFGRVSSASSMGRIAAKSAAASNLGNASRSAF
jgi:Ca-activated chloride channel family protein